MKIGCITEDNTFVQDIQQILSSPYEAVFFSFSKGLLDRLLNDDLIELIIIDEQFFASYILEKDLEPFLNAVIGAGIPIFFRHNSVHPCSFDMMWKIAEFGVRLFSMDTMNSDISNALEMRGFNIETLMVENAFAEVYDEKEISSPATLSAILSENEYILMYVREYLQKNKKLVRVLDLGCGTGRIEEILLTDPEISHHILSIHAVDFAPAYLKKAKERLRHFLSEEAMGRIIFLRRIAEDTRLPTNYFDIVIASFGVICFSRFHKTIPEIHRVVRSSGLVVMNGYNRDALAYDFNEIVPTGCKSLFTAYIDRNKNEMHIANSIIKCFTFKLEELVSFLKIMGLTPQIDSVCTFPTLYGCIRTDYLKQLGRSYCSQVFSSGPISYQSSKLEKEYERSGFFPVLHKLDLDLTLSLKNRGFYFSLAANKEVI